MLALDRTYSVFGPRTNTKRNNTNSHGGLLAYNTNSHGDPLIMVTLQHLMVILRRIMIIFLRQPSDESHIRLAITVDCTCLWAREKMFMVTTALPSQSLHGLYRMDINHYANILSCHYNYHANSLSACTVRGCDGAAATLMYASPASRIDFKKQKRSAKLHKLHNHL